MVESLVAFGLFIGVVMDVPSCVCYGAWPMTSHKGRCHMVKDISRSVSLDIFSPKTTVSHLMHESTTDANFCLCFELVQIGVIVVVDPVE